MFNRRSNSHFGNQDFDQRFNRSFRMFDTVFPLFFGFVFLLVVGMFVMGIFYTVSGRNPCEIPGNTRDYRCIGYYSNPNQTVPVTVPISR